MCDRTCHEVLRAGSAPDADDEETRAMPAFKTFSCRDEAEKKLDMAVMDNFLYIYIGISLM